MGDQGRTLDVADVAGIQFDAARMERDRGTQAPAVPGEMVLPAGTKLVIRMIDAVDSQQNSIGQTFAASLDEPDMIGGDSVIPRGSDVVVKLVDDKESGKLVGRTILTLDMMSATFCGKVRRTDGRTNYPPICPPTNVLLVLKMRFLAKIFALNQGDGEGRLVREQAAPADASGNASAPVRGV